jgi:lipopolysaccharide/colanic/teichoic acid biosynthesis glycosyltransferase
MAWRSCRIGVTAMTASRIQVPGRVLARHSATPRLTGKRVFDLVVASCLVGLLIPILVIVWLLVRTTSPGKGMFRQTRIGRYGRPFVMYKFRTMRADSGDDIHREYVRRLLTEDNPPPGGARGLYKLESDPRVTKVGRLLRRTSLDELPQLLNVVKGDMSLVGPRPALPYEAELFSTTHRARFLVAPGVTGLWQICGRSKLPMQTGLDLDIEYVQRRTFWLDLKILLKTVPAVFTADGAP